MNRIPSLALAIAAFLWGAAPLSAGGPLVFQDGTPYRWSVQFPVVLNLDPGSLGGLSNPEMRNVFLHAVTQWNGVSTSALRVRLGDPLPSDVEDLGVAEFNLLVSTADGTNPMILDSDGSIIDAIYGQGSGVLGVSGPSLVATGTRTILKGFALYNGRGMTRDDAEVLKAVVTHEMGHLLNLEHSQINGLRVGVALPGFDGRARTSDVETMYPILVASTAVPHPMATLHKDDVAAISALYPTESFPTITAAIEGQVLDIDGITPLQGINVIARNVEAPFEDAVSYVSGLEAGQSPRPELARSLGRYRLQGLTPGARYKVYIEEVASFFVGGSAVGPLDPPRDVDPTQTAAFLEFWSGSEEGADDPPDDPVKGTEIAVPEGTVRGAVDFVFNGVAPRVTSVDPPTGSYRAPQEILVHGANFTKTIFVTFDDLPATFLEEVEVIDPSLLRGIVPAGVIPGEYHILVTTTKGRSGLDDGRYVVTEPSPAVLGVEPAVVVNDARERITVTGRDLLGLQAVELVNSSSPAVPLEIAGIISSETVFVDVPRGVYPGNYALVATNTAGPSPPGGALRVTELAPILTGTVSPESAVNSQTTVLRIAGKNLSGTTQVRLVGGGREVLLTIRSTSLEEVTAAVPQGLEPGVYEVLLENTTSAAQGGAVFTVTAAPSGGGGGGCDLKAPAGDLWQSDLPVLLALLFLGRRFRGGRRKPPLPEEAHGS